MTLLGNQNYGFTVIGNKSKSDSHIVSVSEMEPGIVVKDTVYQALHYTFSLDAVGNDFAKYCAIEQQIRSMVWDADQVDSADIITFKPQLTFADKLPNNLLMLNGYSDKAADKVDNPALLISYGHSLAAETVKTAATIATVNPADVDILPRQTSLKGVTNAREINHLLRPSMQKGTVKLSNTALPVLGMYDVLVIGGGTTGAPVAISAARQGVKTLTVEYLHGLGGMMTNGLIGRYWDGFREGFTKEIDAGACNMGGPNHPRKMKNCNNEWVMDWKMEWFRRETIKAGGEIWFGVIACGAVVEGSRVKGVMIATPLGRGIVLAQHVDDSTGSADIAIAAGASYGFTDALSMATQGAGLSRHNPNDFYNNNDWTFIDDSDIVDVTRVFVGAKAKFPGQYDICKLPQTRERRRVLADIAAGDYTLEVRTQYIHGGKPSGTIKVGRFAKTITVVAE